MVCRLRGRTRKVGDWVFYLPDPFERKLDFISGGIAVITINNPPKNVLDFITVKSLIGNLRLLEDLKDCRGVILSSVSVASLVADTRRKMPRGYLQ